MLPMGLVLRRSGFALVLSLSLMSFVLLLVISIVTLTKVEIENARVYRDDDRARENALLGLYLAVARLQESVGPDQRFTATSALTGDHTNANITGVWMEDATDSFTWLISGNTLSEPLAIDPSNLSSPAVAAEVDEVFLVDYGSVSRGEDRIKLPKQLISADEQMGHYAYWVGDEGVKVSMAINDEVDLLDYDNTRPESTPDNPPGPGHNWSDELYRDDLKQMAPSFPNFWKTLGLAHADLVGSQKLASLSSLSMSALLSGTSDPDTWREQFHSITPLSRAVMINHTANNGALRFDLSDAPQTEGSAKRFNRTRSKELESGNQGYNLHVYDAASYSDVFPHFSIGPIMTEFLVRFNCYRDDQGKLTIKQEIQIELWNPYAMPIETGQKLFVNVEEMPDFEVTVDGESYVVQADDYFKDPYDRGPNVPAGTEWAAGEIKWFKGSGRKKSSLALAVDGGARSEHILDSAGNEIDVPDPETSGTPISITVRVPELTGEEGSRFKVTVKTYDIIAEYSPQLEYLPVEASNSTPTLSSSDWLFGYAFEMNDDLALWVDGSLEDSADPRRADMDEVDFADPDFEYWSDDPADTLGPINLSGADSFNTQQNYILYDLPNQEPVSVGALTNLIGSRPNMLGNSWGTEANEYFDKYFFSTLPRWHEWSVDSPPLLPNRYIDYFLTGQDGIELGDVYASSGLDVDIMFDVYHAAKYLMIRGAFNINSVSRGAWRAMLSGINIQDWSQSNGGSPRDLKHAFFRHSMNGQHAESGPDEAIGADNAFARSGMTLTGDQVNELADAVVDGILLRGYPFDSLSEFINAGIIEQAIEDVAVNESVEDLGIIKNSPAYLTQSDVIKTIAPMITPRSDTFLVRSYGDVTDPITGAVVGAAWCEALVQRTPGLTEPVSDTTDLATDPLSPDLSKYPFGRKMKVLSIRYLNSDEV